MPKTAECLDPDYWLDNPFVQSLNPYELKAYLRLTMKASKYTLPTDLSALAVIADLNLEQMGVLWPKLQDRFSPSKDNSNRLVHFSSVYVEPAKPKPGQKTGSLYGPSLYGTPKPPKEVVKLDFDVQKLWLAFPKRVNYRAYEKDSLLKLGQIVTSNDIYAQMEAAVQNYTKNLTKGKSKDEIAQFTKTMPNWLQEWRAWVPDIYQKYDSVQKDDTQELAKSANITELAYKIQQLGWLPNFVASDDLPWKVVYGTKTELERALEWTDDRKKTFLLQEIDPKYKDTVCQLLKALPMT